MDSHFFHFEPEEDNTTSDCHEIWCGYLCSSECNHHYVKICKQEESLLILISPCLMQTFLPCNWQSSNNSYLLYRGKLYSSQSVSMWVGGLHVSPWNYHYPTLSELVSQSKCLEKYIPLFCHNQYLSQRELFSFVCLVPVSMACGSATVWHALLPPLHVWTQSLPVLGGAASPLSGCVTTRMTVAMVQMRSAHLPVL